MTVRIKANINMKVDKYWAVYDKNVIEIPGLSPTAKIVYIYLVGLPQNKYIVNEVIGKNIGLSARSVGRAIQELKKFDLYYIHRTGSKTYRGYLGNTKKGGSASELFSKDMREVS